MSHANAKRVLITGSSGRIGRVLVEALKSAYMVLEADLPKHDLRNSDVCERLVKDSGIDVIIHLAWDTTAENWRSQRVAPGNWRMAENILLSAKKHHIPRVILASSVHVHPYRNSPASDGSLIDSHADCIPTSPYGAHKLSIEKLGLWHSKEGLEVICVRFGGVSKPATPPRDHRIVGLTHADCSRMIICCIEAQQVPNRYTVFYAVSANRKRIHDCSNPFGWLPRDDATSFYCSLPHVYVKYLFQCFCMFSKFLRGFFGHRLSTCRSWVRGFVRPSWSPTA
jgi:nucleoside-diphosphate-sugar epimerase